jgi:hypothetical protein
MARVQHATSRHLTKPQSPVAVHCTALHCRSVRLPTSCKPTRFPASSHCLHPRFLQVLEHHADKDAFCKYNDPLLQLFVSVLFLAGIFGAFLGSFTAKRWGRRPTMMLGGLCFLAGAVLMAPAVHVAMLIVGRVVMGLGESPLLTHNGIHGQYKLLCTQQSTVVYSTRLCETAASHALYTIS